MPSSSGRAADQWAATGSIGFNVLSSRHLVLCGHSCGVAVSQCFAQSFEASGVMVRGFVAIDPRVRTGLDTV